MPSKQEATAAEALSHLGLPYYYEYSPEWAKNKRYDFFFSYRSKCYILEIDGIQHFNSKSRFNDGSIQKLHKRQAKDRLKMKWALSRGINFIRIDYSFASTDDIAALIVMAVKSQLEIFVSDPNKYRYIDKDVVIVKEKFDLFNLHYSSNLPSDSKTISI
jgi:hypothetical protein